MKKILILAANPRKDLNLDREIRDLKRVIESSAHGENFQVVHEPAVRVSDLQDLLFKHRPQIVHFCGHGGGEAGLVFESDLGQEQQVKSEALSALFHLFDNGVECVLLNACYSQDQAEAIVEHIGYVIGMNQEIRDDAAIAFSKGFYRALGYACSIDEAFEFGRNAIQLEISGSSVVRSGTSEATRKLNVANAVSTIAIPEHLKPVIKKNPKVTARSQSNLISQEKRTEIQLELEQFLAQAKATMGQVQSQPGDRKPGWIWGGAAIGILVLGGVGSQLFMPKTAPSKNQTAENAQAYIQKAKEQISAGNLGAAQENLNKAINLDERLATPYCMLAEIHETFKDRTAALSAWSTCENKADLSNPDEAKWFDKAVEKVEGTEYDHTNPPVSK